MPAAGFHTDTFRSALAAALMMPGNPERTWRSAFDHLERRRARRGAAKTFRDLSALDRHVVLAVICAIADYLDAHGAAIDYARRRARVRSDLLPERAWHQMCDQAGIDPGSGKKLKNVRRWLYQRLTGNDLRTAPSGLALTDAAGLADYRRLLLNLPKPLRDMLDRHATDYLAARNIYEPLTWEPPIECAGELTLPDEPADLDVATLHRLLSTEGLAPSAAAQHLGTTIDHVRLVLELSPLPMTTPAPRSKAAGRQQRQLSRPVLTPEFLRAAQSAGKGAKTIARETGFDRRIVSDAIIAAQLPRTPGRQPRHIDRDWLHEQYVVRRRTLPDIAAEIGMSPMNLNRRARALGIPLRQRGGASHAAALAVADPSLPIIVRKAMTGNSAWTRLRRFQAAMEHDTIGQAAIALGVSQATLTTQLKLLERDVGRPVYIRAERGHPMQANDAGRELLDALAAIATDASTERQARHITSIGSCTLTS